MTWQKRIEEQTEKYFQRNKKDMMHQLQHARVQGYGRRAALVTLKREFGPIQWVKLNSSEQMAYMVTLFNGKVRRLVLEVL